LEADSNSTKEDAVKISQKAIRKKRTQKNTTVLEDSISTPQKPSSKTTRKSKKQDVQPSEGSNDNVNMSPSQQEGLNDNVNTSPSQQEGSNDVISANPIPAEEDFLSNESESQCAPSEYILSDNETWNQQKFTSIGSSKSSVTLLSPSQMQSSQSFQVQELFQVKPAEIPKKIKNVAVEVNIQSKKPMQFQNMTNEFEIAYWLAHHKSILDLAMNIRKGMMTGTNEENSISTSPPNTLVQHSFETVSTPSEIDQVICLYLRKLHKAKKILILCFKISMSDINCKKSVKHFFSEQETIQQNCMRRLLFEFAKSVRLIQDWEV
jgi:hypothetical protein